MADANKPLALDNPQYANLVLTLNGELGAFSSGGLADEGWYEAKIKEIGISARDGKEPSLAVTLSGIGSGDIYTYVALPLNPNAEHFNTYQRLLNSFLLSTGYDVAQLANGTAVPLSWIAGFVGQTATVYYYPPFQGADGKLDNRSQEVFFQSAAQRSAAESGGKPPARRNKPPETLTSADVLGHAASSVGAAARPVMPPAAPHAPVSAPVTAPAPAAPAPAAFAPPPPASRPSLPPPPPR